MATLDIRVLEDRVAAELQALQKRVATLERAGTYRIKLADADLLRLQPNDVVVLSIARPLADSETRRLVEGWRELMHEVKLDSVQLMVLAGADTGLQVLRGAQVD